MGVKGESKQVFFKAILLLLINLFIINESECDNWSNSNINEVGFDNPLFCMDNKKCISIDHCPEMLGLMNQKALPVHRFRQLICGYLGTFPKVCCEITRDITNPIFESQKPVSKLWPDWNCGKSLIRSNLETLGTYPFVARIGYINTATEETKYPCSGSILNDRTILTTATCALATTDTYKLNSVLVGDFNSQTDPDCNILFCGLPAQTHEISYVVKHPEFDAQTFRNNVALLRLKSSMNFTVTTQPICISTDQEYYNIGRTANLIGWGKMSNEKEKELEQQRLTMKLLAKEDCSNYLKRGLSVELCALGEQEPCSGYSGSPLVQKHGNTYILVGMLSYGSDCNKQNLPSAFTNVQGYASWIMENA
ncbi:chymotrypsin-like protease CTRL-1 [Cephus cinctus]|uniref:Chymotrypsin-like protease CTRL-1 n=1 Tax=Cephus cinctus TaxID=211228 RepID=A0AAJ7FIV1_CEPCN|nr:chymotrypsin-like protease CTRL-1 [Cephus cinctus]